MIFRRRKNAKKGFSIMEVVIAIAVVSIITVSSITLLSKSVEIESKNIRDMEIAVHVENAVECYRYADNVYNFWLAIRNTDINTWQRIGAHQNKLMLTKETYTIIIEFPSVEDYSSMTIKAKKSADSSEDLYSYTFAR